MLKDQSYNCYNCPSISHYFIVFNCISYSILSIERIEGLYGLSFTSQIF